MNKQEVTNFYNYMSGVIQYITTDKINNTNDLMFNFLNKTLTMFYYENLPGTIPYEELEKILQMQGIAWVSEYEGDLIVQPINLIYDEVDVYNNALKGMVYYPNTKENKMVNVSDGVIIKNDFLGLGLRKIFSKYAYLLNESTITLEMANIWKRAEKVFIANDDATAESVKRYLDKVKNGDYDLIGSSLLYDSINVSVSTSNGNSLHDLIEYDNYIKSQFYNEIGLYHNPNMKKERLITSEVETGLTSGYPLVDNMLNSRKKGIEKLNKKFNLDVKVEFTSSWEYRLNLGENIAKAQLQSSNNSNNIDDTNNSDDTLDKEI